MRTKQSLATKVTYWLKVVSLGMVLGLGLQFAQAWVAPTGAPPAGNVAGPITTGSSQTKVGALTTGGLAAPSFVDTDNAARYVNPSGTSVLWGLSIASLPNCDLKTNASGAVYCGTDATGAGGGVTSLSQGVGITLSPNPITTTGTISADTNYVQRRVSSTCAVGSSIRAINADGTVVCQSVGGGAGGEVKAWVWWAGSILAAGNVSSVTPSGNTRIVTFATPMASANYVVVCNASYNYMGGAEQIAYAFNRTTTSFQVEGTIPSGSDPIQTMDCLVYGN